jgi:plastocyanin
MSIFPALLLAAGLFLTGTAASAATIEITIDQMEFQPAVVTAKSGDTIVWHNKEVIDHTVTAKGAFDVEIPAGKAGSMVVKRAGMFDYDCRFHPNMTGRVEVAP